MSSDQMRRMIADVDAPSSAGRTVASSKGDSIRVTLTARNSLTCMGMLDRERPGATIMHVPTRQKIRKTASTEIDTLAVKKLLRAT